MKPVLILMLLVVGQTIYGQTMSFTNYTHTFPAPAKINEINLNADSTFAFWSRPDISCFTWHQYKGTWRKENDTLFFYDNYEIVENDTRATYRRDSGKSFRISFKTDRNSPLINKSIRVEYIYDYYAHLEESEKTFSIRDKLEIPYKDIPHLNKLAAIRIKYQLAFSEKRDSYLTQNKFSNLKQGDIPNIIGVEFVEKPKKETVYRIIKAVIQKDTLSIVSNVKTKITLPDYMKDIEFEDGYKITK